MDQPTTAGSGAGTAGVITDLRTIASEPEKLGSIAISHMLEDYRDAKTKLVKDINAAHDRARVLEKEVSAAYDRASAMEKSAATQMAQMRTELASSKLKLWVVTGALIVLGAIAQIIIPLLMHR